MACQRDGGVRRHRTARRTNALCSACLCLQVAAWLAFAATAGPAVDAWSEPESRSHYKRDGEYAMGRCGAALKRGRGGGGEGGTFASSRWFCSEHFFVRTGRKSPLH